MKELSIEEKAQRYDEAIEGIREILSSGQDSIMMSRLQLRLQGIFPELKESEDEKIVRCLLNYFHHVRYNGLDLKDTNVDKVIAWLEKQGRNIEYVRKDDFIERATFYIQQHWIWNTIMIDDFKNYMKGE